MPENEIERKFLLVQPHELSEWPVVYKVHPIEQTYLKNEKAAERVRRCFDVEEKSWRYTHTIKTFVEAGHNIEDERVIDVQEYETLLARAAPGQSPIRKLRYVFDWKDLTYEVDYFCYPFQATMLEVEIPSLNTPVEIPFFLGDAQEVTKDRKWSNEAISKRGHGKGFRRCPMCGSEVYAEPTAKWVRVGDLGVEYPGLRWVCRDCSKLGGPFSFEDTTLAQHNTLQARFWWWVSYGEGMPEETIRFL